MLGITSTFIIIIIIVIIIIIIIITVLFSHTKMSWETVSYTHLTLPTKLEV